MTDQELEEQIKIASRKLRSLQRGPAKSTMLHAAAQVHLRELESERASRGLVSVQ